MSRPAAQMPTDSERLVPPATKTSSDPWNPRDDVRTQITNIAITTIMVLCNI